MWGYAAGMVKEPHPKPQSQLQGKTTTTTVTTAVAKGVVVGVGEGGSKKLLKKKKEKEKEKEGKRGKEKEKTGRDEKGKESWWARGKGEVGQQGQQQRQVQSHPYQPFQTGKQVHGSSSQVYPYPHQQQQVQVQTAYMNANAYPRATGGYGSRRKDETEEEDTGEEEEEETGEETGEEGKGGAWTPVRPGSGSGHSWYYTQPLVDETSGSESGRDRGRSDGRSGNRGKHERYSYGDDDDDEEEETDEETPRRTHIRTRSNPISTLSSTPTSRKLPTTKRGMVSRVKEKVDPYAGYEDVSPIGVGNLAKAKARVRPRSFHVSMQEEEEEEERPPRRGRGSQPPKQHQQRERERDWHHEEVPTHTQTQAQAQAHQRSRSAIEEREKQVLIARARARSVSRPRAGGSGRGGHENVDEEEEEEEEEGVLGLAYDDEHEREEEGVFRGRGGVSNKSTTTGTGRAGLPQPPAMVRDGAVGITGNLAGGRKIQGGPRWKGSSSASLLYGDDGTGIGEGGDGRGGNSGGSGEYGYGYGRQHQRQGQGRVAILQSAPGAVEGRGREGEAGVGRAWPADLPRLPRTPGGTGTEEERGNYFDLRSQSRESASHNQTQQGGRAVSEFVTRAGGPRSQSQGLPPSAGATRSASRDQGFTSGHYQRGGRGSKSELDGLNLGLGRDDLDLDDPPPRASVVRTPSPGGYVLQKREDGEERGQGLFGGGYHRQREQQQEQEQGYGAPMNEQGQRQRQQQARPQSQMYGHPPPPQHPQQRHQVIGSRSPFVGNQQHQQLPPPQHPFQPRRKQPQTPAPPPTVGIESPHPVGGRDRLADMHKLDWDSNYGSDHERFSANGDVGEDAGAGASSSPMMTPRISINAATGGGGGGAKTIPTIQIGESEFDSSPRMGHKAPVINVSVDHGSPRKQPRDMSNNNHNNGSSGGGGPRIQIFDVPGVSISGPEFDDDEQAGPVVINVSGPGPGPGDEHHHQQQQKAYSSAHDNSHSHVARRQQPNPPPQSHFQHPQGRPPSQLGPGFGGQARSRPGGGGGGLACSGCHGQITNGRIVSAMGLRWHPTCFKCSVCSTPLEHVSSYEHEGRPYCHLDYHEVRWPCFFLCLNKTQLSLHPLSHRASLHVATRARPPSLTNSSSVSTILRWGRGHITHNTFFALNVAIPSWILPLHFPPTKTVSLILSLFSLFEYIIYWISFFQGELALSGDGEFEGFTVYKGYPYCEACHVRLRLPKCKRCKKSIRDHEDAVEALGGKWCWACFVCVVRVSLSSSLPFFG